MSNAEMTLKQYDHLLKDDAEVAALVIRERLRPVQGPRGVFFPPTFAGIGQGKKSDYHIDYIGPRSDDPEGASRDGVIASRCTVDSVPSQANRLESRLLRYSGKYLRKVTISGSRVGEHPLDLLEVGHRVGDAALRYTADKGFEQFEKALQSYVKGDAGSLAHLAPTSLVFGHWDSRGETKSKARRILRSEIVAYNVARVTKRSQYWSSIAPEVNEDLGQILKEAKDAASRDPDAKNPASQLGMTDVPAPVSPGGVIAFGKIERTCMIALSGLRTLVTFSVPAATGDSLPAESEHSVNPEFSLALRRYLFALALASVVGPGVCDLREGCILVKNGPPPEGDLKVGEYAVTSSLVRYSGDEETFELPKAAEMESYLKAAAEAFFSEGVPEPIKLTFDAPGARVAVDDKRGGGATEPKTKEELVKAILAWPTNSEKEADLKKKKLADLKTLWKGLQVTVPENSAAGTSEGETGSTAI